jgi:hypothetical protein
MAKGQKRGNKEIRKPKSAKTPAAAVSTFPVLKGTLATASASKKKG